jgi:hypothetical protein
MTIDARFDPCGRKRSRVFAPLRFIVSSNSSGELCV